MRKGENFVNSILYPAKPGEAFDNFLATRSGETEVRKKWTPESGEVLPTLYISHGAPPLFDDAVWIDELFSWAQQISQPKAILIISAHWEAAPLSLSSPEPSTPLVYDFSGFAQRYFTMKYETPDATWLAEKVKSVLPVGESLHQHTSRGLDHGAWVPLKIMYPHADVPVLQLSIPTHNPEKLLQLGAALRPLREEGVLVIGSGFMTHGLPFMTPAMWHENYVPTWSSEFDAWAAEHIGKGDIETLAQFTTHAPGVRYAHPTVEHFTPLFVTLGASGGHGEASGGVDVGGVQTAVEGYQFGLAKRSFQID